MQAAKIQWLLIVLLFPGPILSAQSGYRPGYIIKSNGDTLSGLIYYGSERLLKKQCKFKRFELLKPVVYKPSEIPAYGFRNGKYFEAEKSGVRDQFVALTSSPHYHDTPRIVPLTDFTLFKPATRLAAGILVQTEFVRADIVSDEIIYFRVASIKNVHRTAPGFFMDYRLLRKSDILWAGISPVLINGNYHGFASYKNESECRDEIFMDYSMVQVPLYIKAEYNDRRVRPYIKAGVYGSGLIKGKYERFAERQRENRIYQDWYYDFKLKSEMGVMASFGLQFLIGHARQAGIEISYKTGKQMLMYTKSDYGFPMDTRIRTSIFNTVFSVNL